MPARQNGTVDRLEGATSWRARWYDENGARKSKKGFATKSDARDWVKCEVARVSKLRRGETPTIDPRDLPTVQQLADELLEQHCAEPNTLATLDFRLRHVTQTFGSVRIDRLALKEIAVWRRQLPAGSAWHIHKAFRQLLAYAVSAGYLERNVARDLPNPEPKRTEVVVFEHPSHVDAVAAELQPCYRAIPILVAQTGLRPEEWIALERRDVEIDKTRGVGLLRVRRVFTDGTVKPYGKQQRSLRTVALTERAVQALDGQPRRIDTPLLLPHEHGGHLNLGNWRRRHWNPAVVAAGLHVDEHGRAVKRTPYSLRHTYAAWQIAAATTDLFTLARRMGTSLDQIDKTYGHLLAGAIETERDRFTAWQDAQDEQVSE